MGRNYSHPEGKCYLDGHTHIPDNWRPRDPKILDVINKIRAGKGQVPLTLFQPNTVAPTRNGSNTSGGKPSERPAAKASRFSEEVVAAPAILGGYVGVILPSGGEPTLADYALAGRTADCCKHMTFDESLCTFTCTKTQQPCALTLDSAFSLPVRIDCSLCKSHWTFSQIPRDWQQVEMWTTDQSVLPEHMRTAHVPTPKASTTSRACKSTAPPAPTTTVSPSTAIEWPTHLGKPSWDNGVKHCKGNTIYRNKPDALSPINLFAWSYLRQQISTLGRSNYEYHLPFILNGLQADVAQQRTRQLEDSCKIASRFTRPIAPEVVELSTDLGKLRVDDSPTPRAETPKAEATPARGAGDTRASASSHVSSERKAPVPEPTPVSVLELAAVDHFPPLPTRDPISTKPTQTKAEPKPSSPPVKSPSGSSSKSSPKPAHPRTSTRSPTSFSRPGKAAYRPLPGPSSSSTSWASKAAAMPTMEDLETKLRGFVCEQMTSQAAEFQKQFTALQEQLAKGIKASSEFRVRHDQDHDDLDKEINTMKGIIASLQKGAIPESTILQQIKAHLADASAAADSAQRALDAAKNIKTKLKQELLDLQQAKTEAGEDMDADPFEPVNKRLDSIEAQNTTAGTQISDLETRIAELKQALDLKIATASAATRAEWMRDLDESQQTFHEALDGEAALCTQHRESLDSDVRAFNTKVETILSSVEEAITVTKALDGLWTATQWEVGEL